MLMKLNTCRKLEGWRKDMGGTKAKRPPHPHSLDSTSFWANQAGRSGLRGKTVRPRLRASHHEDPEKALVPCVQRCRVSNLKPYGCGCFLLVFSTCIFWVTLPWRHSNGLGHIQGLAGWRWISWHLVGCTWFTFISEIKEWRVCVLPWDWGLPTPLSL